MNSNQHYFICGGSAFAFFVSPERIASITITRTEFQVSVVRVPNESKERFARSLKHTKISKEQFFKIYFAATALNDAGKQKFLELLPVHETA